MIRCVELLLFIDLVRKWPGIWPLILLSGLLLKTANGYSHPDQKLIPKTKRITKSNISKLDFALVLGGDGTYLHTVRMLHNNLIPILGVHLGSFWFSHSISTKRYQNQST